jgi:crossover junction endodeoxyribonuclease RuvC
MLVLGLDPGLRHAGYGLVERRGSRLAVRSCGRLSPDPARPLAERLAALAEGLDRLLALEMPDCAVVEQVFHGANTRSLIVLAEARGALVATLGRRGVAVAEVSPAEVKSAVTGNGRADKTQVARMVRLQLGLGDGALAADTTDALALALYFALRARGVAGLPVGAGK